MVGDIHQPLHVGFCVAMIELEGGKIAHQTVVQAWDE